MQSVRPGLSNVNGILADCAGILFSFFPLAGEARPKDPIAYIAECFTSGQVPDTTEFQGSQHGQSLSAYIAEHQVVALVQQAVGVCAAAQPPPENPLLTVGQYLQERHVRAPKSNNTPHF